MYLYTHVHSGVIHNCRKVETTHLFLKDERISKMWSLLTGKYRSAL